MGLYLGYIEKYESYYNDAYFYNYTPICEIRDGKIIRLSDEAQRDLLPESDKRNINFRYEFNSEEDKKRMEMEFAKDSLVLFDFQLTDLVDNKNSYGERNPTGYRIQVIDMLDNGKICPIHKNNIFRVIDENAIHSDFYSDNVVIVEMDGIVQNDEIFVKLDGFMAGPFIVKRRNLDSAFYIRPQIKENKYTLAGYEINDCDIVELNVYADDWENNKCKWCIFYRNDNQKIVYRDLMDSDELLLESFKESIGNQSVENGKIEISNVEKLIENYSQSALSGIEVTEEIRQRRLKRIVEILTSEADIDSTLGNITDSLCDLLIKYQNSSSVEALLQNILEGHPEFFDKMKDSKIMSERKEKLNEEIQELQLRKECLETEIRETYQSAQSTEQTAIEEKKIALLEMDEQYILQKARLDEILEKLKIAENVSELEQKRNSIKNDINHLEWQKDQLQGAKGPLEEQFLNLVNKFHDKMVGITFDGYMANKMLRSAAEWEAEETASDYENAVKVVNGIKVEELEPEQLIDYLCETIKTVRPEYDRNTIVNIAICITQGFITVFSGEPGCGKTSICNIFAETLGLNKIDKLVENDNHYLDSLARYIPVSVERGWTSKRDFVGYFNPLSKMFDKSNKNIYEALNILDIEKKGHLAKFPYLILLDEANLSPIEYYWADFMNVCDDLDENSYVNLGENHVYLIPETLHFIATINNDHTTEVLSPRLLDRAWVITLPQYYNYGNSVTDSELQENQIKLITWNSMCNAFLPTESSYELSVEMQRIYEAVKNQLRKYHFYISPRVDKAIKKYWIVASKYFEEGEYETDAAIVALDYAIAQKILPQISGYSDRFKEWLEELLRICHDANLNMCQEIVQNIIERGEQMNDYGFFTLRR